MSLRLVVSFLCSITLGVAIAGRAENLKDVQKRLTVQYEGKVVIVRVPDGESVRLEIPKEERGKLAGQREFLLRIERLKLKKKEIEIEGRHIFPFQNEDGEILPVEWTARKYRLRWRKTPRTEQEWEEALAAVLTELKEPPKWLLLLPPLPPRGQSEERGPARSRASEEVALGVFTIGSDVSPPECEYCPDPEYSEKARQSRAQGAVVIHAIISEEGRVRAMKILKPLGHGLDEHAIAAVSRWRFTPALREGKAIRVFMVVEMNFYLY